MKTGNVSKYVIDTFQSFFFKAKIHFFETISLLNGDEFCNFADYEMNDIIL